MNPTPSELRRLAKDKPASIDMERVNLSRVEFSEIIRRIESPGIIIAGLLLDANQIRADEFCLHPITSEDWVLAGLYFSQAYSLDSSADNREYKTVTWPLGTISYYHYSYWQDSNPGAIARFNVRLKKGWPFVVQWGGSPKLMPPITALIDNENYEFALKALKRAGGLG